jgi:Na+/proline symporter
LFANRLGPIINAFNMINSFLGGPILGIFLLGMLTRRARGTDALLGGLAGLTSVSLMAWKTNISFFFYAIVGTVVTFGCGWLLGLREPVRDWTELSGLVVGINEPRSEPATIMPEAAAGVNS